MFLPERFYPFTGPPFLPPTSFPLPVTTTCSGCPHGTMLCSGKQDGGKAGDAPVTLKLGHWPKASSHRGSEPGRQRGGGGGPRLFLLPPPGSLPCLWWFLPSEGESRFGSWLGLAKAKALYPVPSSIAVRAARYPHRQYLSAGDWTSLPFGDGDADG